MKYAIASTILLLICFAIGYAIARQIRKHLPCKHKKSICALLTAVIGCALPLTAGIIYLKADMPAGSKAADALCGTADVTVQKIDGGYWFDGASADKAIIFYPGAKVEYTAYAPLMLTLAQSGYDCFLAEMPLNFSFFGISAADTFINAYHYGTWIMAGHSMGGTVAANYTARHTDKVKGLVLLAAYPTVQIPNSVKLLSVYGSKDGCLEKDVYENSKPLWPATAAETVIPGGNHAAFGDYGFQKGDGSAAVSQEEQWFTTADAVVKSFG